jgi:hypothetical protein
MRVLILRELIDWETLIVLCITAVEHKKVVDMQLVPLFFIKSC